MIHLAGSRLVGLLLLVGTPSLSAQSTPERTAIEALRDSLAALTDTMVLRRLEVETINRAKRDRDDAMLHLQLGFIAYRLGELTDADDRYEDAAGEFEWAAELQPDWPYAWYGLGLAELAKGEHGVIAIENIRQQLGKDHLSKASRAFARAVQADPAFARAAIDLANTAMTQRIRPRLDVAREAVRLAAAGGAGRHAEIHLARGRLEREAGEVDSAVAAFQRALDLGGDSGIALLELARTHFFARRPAAGRAAYFAAARAAVDPTVLALLRDDLRWTATLEEMGAFDALPGPPERAAWLEQFWNRRDVAQARDSGERLAEHYRRWFYARRNFRLVSPHRRYDITEVYRPDQREFDDRGVIYLRHGEPDARASYGAVGVEPNVSWLYRRPGERGEEAGQDLVFHFVARDDVQDYKLVESLADVLGFREALEAQRGGPTAVSSLYASRAEFGTVYRRMGDGIGSAGRLLVEERRAGRRSIEIGTTSDSYHRKFEMPLDLIASDFVVGTTMPGSAAQELHVVFAVPSTRLVPVARDEGALYPLQFRLFVTDSSKRVTSRLDTVRVFHAATGLPGGAYLVGRLTLPVSNGVYSYRLLVATLDGTAGQLVTRDSLTVPTLDGSQFAASDLVLGHAASGLRWTRLSDTVLLSALSRFPERQSLQLYYEVYGLTRGASYRTVVRLEKMSGGSIFSAIGRVFGGRRAPVMLEFDAPADGPQTIVTRSLDLRDTPRGRYRLSVELTDPASDRRLVRVRELEVVASP